MRSGVHLLRSDRKTRALGGWAGTLRHGSKPASSTVSLLAPSDSRNLLTLS